MTEDNRRWFITHSGIRKEVTKQEFDIVDRDMVFFKVRIIPNRYPICIEGIIYEDRDGKDAKSFELPAYDC